MVNKKKSHDYILAVHCGHNASCALMRDGEIIIAVQEERFSREKNHIGYPKKSIDYCIGEEGIKGADIAHIAYTTTNFPSIFIKSKHFTRFSLRDYMGYYGERFYKKKLMGEDCLDYLKWLRDDDKFNKHENYFDFSYLTDEVLNDTAKDLELFRMEQKRVLSEHLGISMDRIQFLDHHTCHAYYGYFGSFFRGDDCIVITLDSWGDGRNHTVWKVSNDELVLLAESDQADIGRIYKMVTLILGMRPDEHEYKVMGLAPYAKNSYVQKTLAVFKDLLQVDGMRIVHKNRPDDIYSFLKDVFADHRFDNIAGAVQLYVEELIKLLVTDIYSTTGIRRYVISGGVSMNVKMNKAVSELDCVDSLFVCGSGGDESVSIGGCYFLNKNSGNNQPLKKLYLGYDIKDELNAIDWESISKNYAVRETTSSEVAKLLAKGDIVAVINGCAEFGARALGNRSILADPSRRESVSKINEAIKNRDFWMPFALSILEEHAHKYINNPKNLMAPFMTLAFDTVPDLYHHIHAGTHPYDRTVRPQYVSKEYSPDFYKLIDEFYKLTGIPALLNTSFNLHGEPIVNGISDALQTFRLSGLDHLLAGSKLISKNNRRQS